MSTQQRKPRVAVVFGGRSTEHSVSCVSAGSILGALDRAEFDVMPIGITREGRWVLTTGDPSDLQISGRAMPHVSDGAAVMLAADPTARGLIAVEPAEGVQALSEVDVVFPVLHGAYGEDGTIQGLLEMADLPYVGSGVLASAAAMDKAFTKTLLAAAGLPVGEYVVLRRGEELTAADQERLGLPVFVKPARAGSSIGITKVTDWVDVGAAVATARAVDPKVIIEAGIDGREVECGVLEGANWGAPEASVLAEIRLVAQHDWYDFEAKYLDDACEFDIPAKLDDELTATIREMACRAFTALDCAGLARVDFFVREDGSVVVNEINTMPGFTPISMFPRMWAATGVEYPELLSRLVRVALARGTGLR